MGWRAPYAVCTTCGLEESIDHDPTILNTPAGKGRRIVELGGLNIKLVDPNIPAIYSKFEFHFCDDCERFTDWFMAKYEEKENNFLKPFRDEEDLDRSILYFESNPNIKPNV